MHIEVKHVSKSYGAFQAVKDVSLQVQSGELLALLGPSGSGKTTLLRIMAGLEQPDTGTVHHGGVDVTQRATRERNVGFVFQHYALFNQMTVFENIAFGLRVRHERNEVVEQTVHGLLRLIRLEHLAKRLPSQLSGGQRQRVALARALAPRPSVLLLDEPFGALDAKVRQELRDWLRQLHEEMHVTSVFVTHDQEEAFEIADRVVVTNRGGIEQVGRPAEVFESPVNAFVMDFLGHTNVMGGTAKGGRARLGGVEWTSTVDGEQPVRGYVRHCDVIVSARSDQQGWTAKVRRVARLGTHVRAILDLAGQPAPWTAELDALEAQKLNLFPGMQVHVAPRQIHLFSEEPGPSHRC